MDIDRFIVVNQPAWSRLESAGGRRPAAQAAGAGRARRARPALPAGVGPPVPRPGLLRRPRPHRPAHRTSSPRPTPSSTRGVGAARCAPPAASSPRRFPPRCGSTGGSWSSPPCCCSFRRSAFAVWFANSSAVPRPRPPARGGGGRARGRVRGLLLVAGGRAVRGAGVHQQHPGVVPGLRRRHPALRPDRPAADQQRRDRRGVGRVLRRHRPPRQVLRADPAPRPARADRRVHRRRRRPLASAGRSSPRATGPGPRPWPRRADGRS